jgi:hypothetical protein
MSLRNSKFGWETSGESLKFQKNGKTGGNGDLMKENSFPEIGRIVGEIHSIDLDFFCL